MQDDECWWLVESSNHFCLGYVSKEDSRVDRRIVDKSRRASFVFVEVV